MPIRSYSMLEVHVKPMEGDQMNRLLMASLFLFSISSTQTFGGSFCLNPEVKSQDDSALLATNIVPVAMLLPEQRNLLETFLNQTVNQNAFESWSNAHNDQVATFLATTLALSRIELALDSSHKISGLDMIESLHEIRGVRLIATLNKDLFDKWRTSGGHYTIYTANGKKESGKVPFASHYQKGGGLHCGYDIQGYTHYNKVPYIHWNVNETDGSADLHLDGMEPWHWGFIPNPNHLTYANSDVRAWYKNFVKKFGSPGFDVTKSQTPKTSMVALKP